MDKVDAGWLRYSFSIAEQCLADGDQPFGAVLVDGAGGLLLTGRQTRASTRDCTAHAETNVIRDASQRWTRDFLQTCTLYSSTEPCLMCSGAFGWSGIGRLVFGLSQARMYAEFSEAGPPRFRDPVDCRALLSNVRPPVVVIGPLLEEEALAPHRLAWASTL